MNACNHCPVPPGLVCPGSSARRLCDLVNPDHPDYQAGYDRAILATARPPEDPEILFARLEAARLAWEALPPEEQQRRCCD